jgi:6-phosphogluconolactonase
MKSNSTAETKITVIDRAALYEAAASLFTEVAATAIGQKSVFTTALSGGATPQPLYSLLAESYLDELDWRRTHVFFSDERCVPPYHPDSNYRMIHETLLSKTPISADSVHRMKGEIEPKEAAADYCRMLRKMLGETPAFDLLLLGIGQDCHTASLFPGSEIFDSDTDMTAAVYVSKLQSYRLTLTPQVITSAALMIVLATGKDKAHAVREAIQGTPSLSECPAQLLRQSRGQVVWLLDKEAASELDSPLPGK